MGERAENFMQMAKDKSQPFFIQMSYHALHYPENALPATIEKYKNVFTGRNKSNEINRAAIAENLDTGIGRLLDAVDKLDLADNTYVIYLSDNGGGGGGKKRTLRGGKGSLQEGGIRVPCIIRGPGIKAGSFCCMPIVTHDLLPTLCNLAGVRKPLPADIEGGDFSHLLTGGTVEVKRRFPGIAFHFPHYQGAAPHSAMRIGDYKIIIDYESDTTSLYNIAEDPSENNDLKKQMPEMTSNLKTTLQHYLKDIGAMLPAKNPQYDPLKPAPDLKKRRPPEASGSYHAAPRFR
jgi:arylsulfatase A-like enzyme